MAKSMTHLIEYPDDGSFFPDWIKTISYGKCQTTPYAESGLWFVSIPHGKYDEWKADGRDIDELLASPYGNRENKYQKIFPEQDTTFLVTENYARIEIFNQFRRDVKAWEKVAHKVFVGKWCAKFEKLWQDVQIQEYALPGKVGSSIIVKYGYCRTTKKHRDLWFVSFQDEGKGDDHTFIVDEVCTTPSFIKHLKTHSRKWEPLCWCYLRHEVEWENLKTGLDAKDLERFQLDSPYSLESIDEQIKIYQDEMSKGENIQMEKPKKKGWFS